MSEDSNINARGECWLVAHILSDLLSGRGFSGEWEEEGRWNWTSRERELQLPREGNKRMAGRNEERREDRPSLFVGKQ